MAYITLLQPARINDRFKNFARYLQSIIDCADDVKNIEVLVKFDDDQDITDALKLVDTYKAKGLQIKYIHTPRMGGYQDISYFYSNMIPLADSSSLMFMAGSVDVYFLNKGFDTKLIKAAKKYEDEIFVIHTGKKLSVRETVVDINQASQHVECFPFWSKRWIEIQGAFGYNALNDGYTGLIEYILAKEYGIDRRIDLSHFRIIKETDGGGGVMSDYWQGPRRAAVSNHLTPQSIAFARQAAKNLALNISKASDKADFANHLINSCLDNTDRFILLSGYKCLKR